VRERRIRGGGHDFPTLSVLVVVHLALASCSDSMGPGPDVRLEVSLSQNDVSPGETITISVTVHNPGERPAFLGERCPPVGFRVLDEDGRRVGPAFNWEGTFVCVGEIVDTVPAGESRMFGFLWSPVFNYGSSSNVPLPSGTYWIFAGFAGEPLRPPLSDRVVIHVEAG
jgi:hypothetical protein